MEGPGSGILLLASRGVIIGFDPATINVGTLAIAAGGDMQLLL